ncbi:transcription termination/antitermination protein NusG [Cohaesibacter marisflavi]|uniref:transcription termination/antitermination protein NusG n=1 Tax=Cohaesibacter marisflavi TaxID=655353 RepID=UPI0029C8943C|nr:hypothetical protein [Cohaesibacter marisflavi]
MKLIQNKQADDASTAPPSQSGRGKSPPDKTNRTGSPKTIEAEGLGIMTEETKLISVKLDLLKEIEGQGLVKQSRLFHEVKSRYMSKIGEFATHDETLVWFVGRCDADKTLEGQVFLHERGFPTYVPLEVKRKDVNGFRRKQRAGKKHMTRLATPFMPGTVLFAMPREKPRWQDLYSAPRTIWDVYGFAGIPCFISAARMRKFIDDNNSTFKPIKISDLQKFAVGDRAQIVDGVYDGFVVDITKLDKKHAWVDFEIFGRSVEARVDIDKIERVS